MQPLCAERLESRVELPPRLAELLVARIAEREHRIAHMLETRRLAAREELGERHRALGRVAIAMGADDEEQSLQVLFAALQHIEKGEADAALGESVRYLLREALGIAGLRSEEHRHGGPARFRSGCRGGHRLGLEPCQESAEPQPLLAVELGEERTQLCREGRWNGRRAPRIGGLGALRGGRTRIAAHVRNSLT
jgi:hypothetical protein